MNKSLHNMGTGIKYNGILAVIILDPYITCLQPANFFQSSTSAIFPKGFNMLPLRNWAPKDHPFFVVEGSYFQIIVDIDPLDSPGIHKRTRNLCWPDARSPQLVLDSPKDRTRKDITPTSFTQTPNPHNRRRGLESSNGDLGVMYFFSGL